MRHPSPSAQNFAMDGDLAPVVDALADLSDSELHAMIDASKNEPQITPELLA